MNEQEKIIEERVDLLVDLWHCGTHPESLPKYLGWSPSQYNLWLKTDEIPWVEKLYHLARQNRNDEGTDLIFAHMIPAAENSSFEEIAQLLEHINPKRLTPKLSLAFLFALANKQKQIKNFEAFKVKMKNEIKAGSANGTTT